MSYTVQVNRFYRKKYGLLRCGQKLAKDRLDENGFTELLEGDKWDVDRAAVNITLYEIRHQ